MPSDKQKFSPDKFPGLLESPGTYRKSSDDFGVTFAVPATRVEHIQPLMQKAGKIFVVYLIACADPEQADALLKEEVDPPADGRSLPAPETEKIIPDTVPVAVLADLLDMTERNVQILEKKGIVYKDARGHYQLRESVRGVLKEERLRGDGKNSDHNRERTEAMRLKRLNAEVEYLERIGKLVNANEVTRAIEQAQSQERQSILNMPKNLAPRLEGLTLVEMEVALNDWAGKHLAELASITISGGIGQGGIQDHDAPAEAERKPVGGRKKKTRRKK